MTLFVTLLYKNFLFRILKYFRTLPHIPQFSQVLNRLLWHQSESIRMRMSGTDGLTKNSGVKINLILDASSQMPWGSTGGNVCGKTARHPWLSNSASHGVLLLVRLVRVECTYANLRRLETLQNADLYWTQSRIRKMRRRVPDLRRRRE